jgi:hypothetical protein
MKENEPSGTNLTIMKSKIFSPGAWSLSTRIMVPALFVLVVWIVIIGLNNVIGLALGITAVAIVVLAITRRWRRIRSYLFLAGGTFLGAIILSGIYMEVARPLAIRIGGQAALDSTPWKIFQAIVSDGILLIGASAIIIGIVGAIVLAVARAWTDLRRPAATP